MRTFLDPSSALSSLSLFVICAISAACFRVCTIGLTPSALAIRPLSSSSRSESFAALFSLPSDWASAICASNASRFSSSYLTKRKKKERLVELI